MTKEEAVKEIEKAFEPAFANYIITALTEGATVSDFQRRYGRAYEAGVKDGLVQEPCEDAVSRAEVKKIAKEMYLEVANMKLNVETISDCISYTASKCREVLERKLQDLHPVTLLSEHEKFILSQMVNSDVKTIEEIGLMYQKQLAEMYQQQNFYLNR